MEYEAYNITCTLPDSNVTSMVKIQRLGDPVVNVLDYNTADRLHPDWQVKECLPEMLSPRGQSGLTAKILASASVSSFSRIVNEWQNL